jgi:hypothetical protein
MIDLFLQNFQNINLLNESVARQVLVQVPLPGVQGLAEEESDNNVAG